MISNKKIFSLARKIGDENTTPFVIPDDVLDFLNNQTVLEDYFYKMGPDSFIKLAIAIWGFSLNMNESQIEKMYNDVFFAIILNTDGEEYEEECPVCDGSGDERCPSCKGSGTSQCSYCEGEGEVECPECNGYGEIDSDDEEDDGTITCPECNGSTYVPCDECSDGETICYDCSGRGTIRCSECDSLGYIPTNELEYDIHFIVCWDSKLKSKFEKLEGSDTPLMTWSEFANSKYIMTLSVDDESHAEFIKDIQLNEIYCIEFFESRPKDATLNMNASFTMPKSWVGTSIFK